MAHTKCRRLVLDNYVNKCYTLSETASDADSISSVGAPSVVRGVSLGASSYSASSSPLASSYC